MDPDKTFCLKWNNFQQNIFSTIRNLRLDLDFLDVTIFCKGKQVKAHKVILSACSNTFKAILKNTPTPHPVIVLWDMEHKDLTALLDFMYNGQVDIQQDDLERFLVVADKLQVRGLSAEENGEVNEPERNYDSRKRPIAGVHNTQPPKVIRRESPSVHNNHSIINNVSEKEVVIHGVEVKTEIEESHRLQNAISLPQHSSTQNVPIGNRNLNFAGHRYRGEHADYPNDAVDYHTESVEYPVDPVETYDDYYEDDVNYASAQYPIDYSLDNSPGKSPKSVKCPYCDKVLKYRHNLKGHIQNQHGAGEPEAPCPICPDKIFKNSASLRDHMSRKHRAEKQAAYVQQTPEKTGTANAIEGGTASAIIEGGTAPAIEGGTASSFEGGTASAIEGVIPPN